MRIVFTRDELFWICSVLSSVQAGRFPSQGEISLLDSSMIKMRHYLGATDGPASFEFPTYGQAQESLG